jgi:hypothetical protein
MNFKISTLLAAVIFAGIIAQAKVSVGPLLKVESEVEVWNTKYSAVVEEMQNKGTYPADGFTECRETAEIQGAYLCVSDTQLEMNMALARASAFIEGLGGPGTKGKVVRLDDPELQQYLRIVGGHDLRGQDLNTFLAAATKACNDSKQDPNVCFNPYEKEIFENFISPKTKINPNFVVITYAVRSSMSWQDVVTHEILHAQYFNQPEFRKICDNFWNTELTDEDRAAVKFNLGRYYDSSDELLMMNEFQAYMLMTRAESQLLVKFVGTFRAKLLEQLALANLKPVEVQ